MADQQIQVPGGLVVFPSHGVVQADTAQALMDMRSFTEAQGLKGIGWQMVPGSLVEKARNDACRHALRSGAGWLFMLDSDMVPNPDCLIRLLQTAYGTHPHADVVGGWCGLRGDLALPTIDTGTGTWESHYPGSGVLEVMRTGGACLLIKRHVLERMGDPWFRMRVPARPVDFMAEIDNFCRIKFDGRNPFRGLPGEPWEKLQVCAQQDPSSHGQWTPAEVGEDSGFCDRAKLLGFRLFVNTDVEVGHKDSRILKGSDHRAAVDKMKLQQRQVVGLLS